MNGTLICILGALLVGLALASTPLAGGLSGSARIIDGDTIEVAGERIRLLDIDAPETAQRCTRADGAVYECGASATAALASLTEGARVRCIADGKDRYGRLLATCIAERRSGPVEINRSMVALGWAVRYDARSAYLAEELDAAKARRGLWAGSFEQPRAYRSGRWTTARTEAPDGCPIKGNVSSNGRIYHTPWSRHYNRTRIDTTRGERWFCSEAEALAAGWRAPYQ